MNLKRLASVAFIAGILLISKGDLTYAQINNLEKEVSTYAQESKSYNGWKQSSNGRWSYYKNGKVQVDQWKKDNNKWYYLDSFGYMVSNTEYYINGTYYIFGQNGARIDKKGWIKRIAKDSNSKNIEYWYYGNGDGSVKTSKWVKGTGKLYYFDDYGKMIVNTVKCIDGKDYIFDKNGAIIYKKGWIKFDWSDGDGKYYTDWCYGNGDGTVASNKWIKDKNKWYYINDKFMAYDTSVKVDEKWYVFGRDGAIVEKYGWVKITYDGTKEYDWFYGNGDGTVKVNQWVKDKDKWYYLENGGYLSSSLSTGSTQAIKNKVATVGSKTIKLRKYPNDKHSVIYEAGINQVVLLKEKNSNGWYKVELPNGVVGWCSGKYLNDFKYFNEATLSGLSQADIDKNIENVVSIVTNQLGKPYVWAAVGPNKFDCSGLMLYSYKQGANVELSDYSAEQAVKGRYVSKSELKKGDLVFFDIMNKGRVSHVGMYVGGGNFIHAANTKTGVIMSKLSETKYSSKYICARRII